MNRAQRRAEQRRKHPPLRPLVVVDFVCDGCGGEAIFVRGFAGGDLRPLDLFPWFCNDCREAAVR